MLTRRDDPSTRANTRGFRLAVNAFAIATFAVLSIALTACEDRDGATANAASGVPEAGQEEDHREGEGGHVRLTPEQIRTAGIALAVAGPAVIREQVSLYGVVEPNAERMREVAARFPGVIRSVTRRVGDPVRKGDTLATVESNESLQTYPVISPLSGVLIARTANPGEQVGDKALFTVADLSSVWVQLSLFPRDMVRVKVGQAVRVMSADTGAGADGTVVYVAPFGSSSNQTLTARVLLDNTDRRWPPGLYVTADVTLTSATMPLTVTSGAVQTLDQRTVVFVRTADGFEPRVVQIGRSDGEFSEILAGVSAGETYVSNNSFILKAELGKGEAGHDD